LYGQGGLSSAKASLQTPNGLLSCEWKIAGSVLKVDVTVPVNTTAEVVIPAKNEQMVNEGSARAIAAAGIKEHRFEQDRLILLVGSGRYTFTTSAAGVKSGK
jgi:hypothetical protein